MNFRPPESYTRLRRLGLITDHHEFRYDVEWCPIMRWVESEPERLIKYEAEQPIRDYFMFGATAGGDPWCWHAGIPTTGDEFEIHQVDLFMYLPMAATLEGFLLRKHLEGIVYCDHLDSWRFVAGNSRLLEALLSPEELTEVRSIEQRVHLALSRGDNNPFQWDDFYAVIERRLGTAYARR